MNKSELINELNNLHPKLRKPDTKKIVDELFQYIKDNLAAGKRIEIRGFGSFCLKHRKAGVVRNPRHCVAVEKGERHVAYFRAGKELSKRADFK